MNKSFWKYALLRACRTVCQTAVATIGSAFVITDVNWLVVVSASVLAGMLSILTSIATGLPEDEYEKHLYQYRDEPADAEVTDDDD